ncbi:MAG: hypothetical protein HY335_04070 [Deinococcus sp.]|nr:hypothetical protein [Deinococcus sp.]
MALRQAWRYLLQNHPHDSICGCSIDQVHREMLPRLDQAEQIAELVSERAMQQVTQALNTAQLQDNGTALVVYNPSNWRRSDGLETVLHLAEEEAREFHIVDPTTGQCLPHQVLEISRDVPFEGREDKLNLPRRLEQMKDRMGLRRYEIRREGTTVYLDLAWGVPRTPDDTWDALIADATKQVLGDPSVQHFHLTGKRTAVRIFLANSDLPLLGYRTYVLRPGPAPAVDSTLRAGERQLENESLRVEVANNGTLTITDLASGTVHRGCHLFEHIADAGDEYTFSPAQGATALTSAAAQAQVSLVETGPARATLQIKVDLQLPLGLTAQRRPNRRRVKYPVTSYVSLVPGSRRVEIRTTLTNTAQDHRLRVLFSTGLVAQEVTVDGHFCTLQRPVDPPAGTGWVEQPSRTNHQMAFVDVSDGQRGFALLNRGLPEYEAIREANGQITLALTLLRCVGYLSRPDLLNRPGNAGPGFAAPGAQCPGQHTFHYAIYLHQGTWEQGVLPEAHSFNQPLRATLATKQQGTLPLEQSFLQVEPEQLVVSALKRAEHGQGLILRVYNPTNQAVPARLRWFQPLNAVTEARLDETPLGPATMAADGTFTCTIGAQQVKSFELHRS